MFAFTFLYPRPERRSFDFEYHLNVHMPMGIALTKRFLGIEPKLFFIERVEEGPHVAFVHLLFETMRNLETFQTLHSIPEAVAEMQDDYTNYTELPPQVRVSRCTLDQDIPAVIARYEQIAAEDKLLSGARPAVSPN